MDCILLGSGGMMPMPYRNLTSLVVRHEGRLYMFDAGEGTQIALKKAKLGIKSLRVIAVSHLHGDHCLGLPGLLMMRAQVPNAGLLTLLGPPGIEKFVTQTRELLGYVINYPITFVEWSESQVKVPYEDEVVQIRWAPLAHTVLCLGFRLQEHPRPGKFRPNAALSLGVPRGPLWGRLQAGQRVILEDGTMVSPAQVLGPSRPGRSVCYAVDTRPSKSLYELCDDADLGFLDGMFLPEHAGEAATKGHMTVDEAARIASRANLRRVILVHISPRYDSPEDLALLNQAASRRYSGAEMGMDLAVYPVRLPDDTDSSDVASPSSDVETTADAPTP